MFSALFRNSIVPTSSHSTLIAALSFSHNFAAPTGSCRYLLFRLPPVTAHFSGSLRIPPVATRCFDSLPIHSTSSLADPSTLPIGSLYSSARPFNSILLHPPTLLPAPCSHLPHPPSPSSPPSYLQLHPFLLPFSLLPNTVVISLCDPLLPLIPPPPTSLLPSPFPCSLLRPSPTPSSTYEPSPSSLPPLPPLPSIHSILRPPREKPLPKKKLFKKKNLHQN